VVINADRMADVIDAVFLEIHDAVHQIDDKPVQRTDKRQEPGVVSGKQPSESKNSHGCDGRDVKPANAGKGPQGPI